jgi:hypothetical protein
MAPKRLNPGAGDAGARGTLANTLYPEITTVSTLDAIANRIARAFGHDVSPLLIVLWWGVAR